MNQARRHVMSRREMGKVYYGRSVVTLVLGYATLMARAFPVAKAPVALVTGANRGLGMAISEVLSEKGYHVIMASRAEKEGRRAVDSLEEKGYSASFLKLDVTSMDDIMRAASYFEESETRLDLLINNAGVCIRDARDDALRTSLEVNAMGPMRLTKALLPHLRPSTPRGGSVAGAGPCVVCVSSGDGELAYLHSQLSTTLTTLDNWQEWEAWMAQLCTSPWANERLGDISPLPWPAYSLSKAALNAASRLLHHEMHVQQTGVAIKSLCPGDVLTDMCDIPEEERANAPHLLTSLEAARDVVWVAENHDACPSGHFYRGRERIPW